MSLIGRLQLDKKEYKLKCLIGEKIKKIIELLVNETGNPESCYIGLIWTEREIRLDDIEIDWNYYKNYESYHGDYFDQLKEDIRKNGIKKPLIILYRNNLLADGYHRFKAARELGREVFRVYHGFYPGNKLSWDLERKCFVSSILNRRNSK